MSHVYIGVMSHVTWPPPLYFTCSDEDVHVIVMMNFICSLCLLCFLLVPGSTPESNRFVLRLSFKTIKYYHHPVYK